MTRHALAGFLLAAALAGCGEARQEAREPAGVRNAAHPREVDHELVSDPFVVDRIYRSMLGPVFARQESLESAAEPDLLWITGYAMSVVGADGARPTRSSSSVTATSAGRRRCPRGSVARCSAPSP
jgi:hypothetical protein